ncbi:hypothetical protein K1719_012150 [Acacia pycnantha]|nr:hypothetical protein K1719_012150 [Acacia pycnantha]
MVEGTVKEGNGLRDGEASVLCPYCHAEPPLTPAITSRLDPEIQSNISHTPSPSSSSSSPSIAVGGKLRPPPHIQSQPTMEETMMNGGRCNDRVKYVNTFMDHLVSWDAAMGRLARAKAFVNLGEPKIPIA